MSFTRLRAPSAAAVSLSIVVIVGVVWTSGCAKESCELDCAMLVYNDCTCGASDPCYWAGDNFCDAYYCAQVTSNAFDDSQDCGDGASCNGDCGLGVLNACTCAGDDPCGWIRDGYCDTPGCTQAGGGGIFDDSEDCDGSGGACDGRCTALQYTSCTCGADDPCGWAGDGTCDLQACIRHVGDAAFDDTVDCQGGPSEVSFGVTAVRDDLDNNDLTLMADGLTQLGYQLAVRDLNVTSASLASLLAEDITTFYHTGHGFEEGIATSDGVLYLNQISLGVRHAIMATCLALSQRWDGCFGSSTESVLGYSKVSFDFIDDEVVRQLLGALGNGSSYPQAWYLANAGIGDVSDRWVAYVSEGGGVVEYSARSGATPQADGGANETSFVELGRSGRVLVAARLLHDNEIFSPPSAHDGLIVSEAATFEGSFLSRAWPRFATARMSRAEAGELAEAFIEERLDGLPVDAALDRISEVRARRAGDDDDEAFTAGFIVRFGRYLEGLPIRGNLVADHITVLVGAEGVMAWSRYWPALIIEGLEAPLLWDDGLLTVGEAVSLAADGIARSVKGELRLVSARVVLGTRGPSSGQVPLVPAYELEGDDGTRLVVDALTGHVVR